MFTKKGAEMSLDKKLKKKTDARNINDRETLDIKKGLSFCTVMDFNSAYYRKTTNIFAVHHFILKVASSQGI